MWCETVRLELKSSILEMAFVLMFHFMALLALMFLATTTLLKLGLAGLIVVSLGLCGRKFLPGFSKRLLEVQISPHQVSLVYRNQTLEAGLPRVAYLSEYLVILEFDLASPLNGNYRGKANLLLLPDSLSLEQFRRLRCYLKHRLPAAR